MKSLDDFLSETTGSLDENHLNWKELKTVVPSKTVSAIAIVAEHVAPFLLDEGHAERELRNRLC